MSQLNKIKVYDFPKITDPRGNLSFIEGAVHIPFPIRRAYYIYDVPGGETRGGHAHRESQLVAIAISGSVTVRFSDGKEEREVVLNRSNRGVLIPPGVWHTLHDFTTGTVMLVLASTLYDEADYIRDYDQFLEYLCKEENNG